jgi:hypothetical protein
MIAVVATGVAIMIAVIAATVVTVDGAETGIAAAVTTIIVTGTEDAITATVTGTGDVITNIMTGTVAANITATGIVVATIGG